MSSKTRGCRLALFLLAAAWPAGAQDYPATTDSAALISWLGKSTNIAPGTVVSVTPELVVAIVGKTPTPGGPVRLTLREEVIAPDYAPTVGGRSSLMSLEIHCDERRIRMDERRLYSGLNMTGSVEITEPSAEWVRIPEGSIMDEVARAACEPSYIWPLQTSEVKPPAPIVASAPPSPPVEEKVAMVETPTPPEPEIAPAPPTPEEPRAAEVEAHPLPPAPIELSTPASSPDNNADASVAPPAETSPAEVTKAVSAPTVAVQIGAYETREAAEASWEALKANRPVLVEGLRFEIQSARVKGRDWLRGLVRDFATRKEAKAFCTAIAGGEYGCILRTLRD